MAPLQRKRRVTEDDRVEIEENYGCQSSTHDLYLYVPLARGSFPLYSTVGQSNGSAPRLLRALKMLLSMAARYARQIARLCRAKCVSSGDRNLNRLLK